MNLFLYISECVVIYILYVYTVIFINVWLAEYRSNNSITINSVFYFLETVNSHYINSHAVCAVWICTEFLQQFLFNRIVLRCRCTHIISYEKKKTNAYIIIIIYIYIYRLCDTNTILLYTLSRHLCGGVALISALVFQIYLNNSRRSNIRIIQCKSIIIIYRYVIYSSKGFYFRFRILSTRFA